MAIDPETIYATVFAIVSSVGAALGGQKVIDKRRQSSQPAQSGSSDFCAEHHKCFDELKDKMDNGFRNQNEKMEAQNEKIYEIAEGVAFLKGLTRRGQS